MCSSTAEKSMQGKDTGWGNKSRGKPPEEAGVDGLQNQMEGKP